MTRGLFVTGTDTGVGKTRVTCAVIAALKSRGLRVVGMKPVASGSEGTSSGLRNEDALLLQATSNVAVAYEQMNPYCFEPAIAPHLAAQQIGIQIDMNVLTASYRKLGACADVVVVEGAGGWRVPLNDQHYFSGLPQRTGMDVLLVVGLRLGCINHAVLTAEAIQADGCSLVGWVGSRLDPAFEPFDSNLATLRRCLRVPCWGVLPYESNFRADAAAAVLSLDVWPGWR